MNITKREKGIGIAGIAGLTLLLCIQVYIRPAIARTNTLKRVVPEKRKILSEIQAKSIEYNTLQKSIIPL